MSQTSHIRQMLTWIPDLLLASSIHGFLISVNENIILLVIQVNNTKVLHQEPWCLYLQTVSRVPSLLTTSSVSILNRGAIFSSLNSCKSFLTSLLASVLAPHLHCFQSSRVSLLKWKSDHVTSLFKTLYSPQFHSLSQSPYNCPRHLI